MELTPEQIEVVETEILEFFAHTQDEVAAELGIKPLPDGKWSEKDVDRIFAEINRRYRQTIVIAGDTANCLIALAGVEQIRNTKALSDKLSRIAPLLRTVGVDV